MARLVLVAGIPSVGKSHYGHWAERLHGVAHIDAEQAHWGSCHALRQVWSAEPTQIPSFVAALRQDGRPIIFNWGFPIDCMETISAFKREGVSLWWFSGDGDQCRRRHALAGKDVTAFDCHMARIRGAWPAIELLFGKDYVVDVLRADGSFTSCEDLHARLFP